MKPWTRSAAQRVDLQAVGRPDSADALARRGDALQELADGFWHGLGGNRPRGQAGTGSGQLIRRAGTPTAVQPLGTSRVTTDPAPILAKSPMLMSPIIVAPVLSKTPLPILGARSGVSTLPPDGDVLQDGHLVADGHERSDHDAGGMIQEYRRPDRRGWVDAHLKGIRRLALQQQCEVAAIPLPEPVRHPPGLQRHVPLEIDERRQKCRRCRVMKNDSLRDRGARPQRGRATPQTLRWRRAQIDADHWRFYRAAVRSDRPPQRRGRSDRGSKPPGNGRISDRWPRPFQPRAGSSATALRWVNFRPRPCPIRPSGTLNRAGALPNIRPSQNRASPAPQAQMPAQKQTAHLLEQMGGSVAVRFDGGHYA